MKIKKHVRRGSLAALIALALTSSALAMPTGGEVVRGAGDITVNGGTDFSTIANNATITANNDGQIKWQTFNIANGETLNFNIANNKTLVNQVTGAQLSDILGTMNQTGSGSVVLVNPNGIHIGATAVLNVSDLTLSALSIDQATDTTRVLKAGGGTGALAGQIVVDADAANHASFTANELNLIGQKVTVADGVVFDMGGTAGTGKAMLQVYATDNAAWTFDGDRMQTKNLTHNAGNDVSFGGTVIMNAANNSKDVEIGGATTQVKNAVFHGDKLETTAYAASKLSIDKRDADINKHSFVAEATAANTLTADHIQAEGDSLSLGGGAVALKNSTINVDDVSLDGVAKSATKGDGVRTETLTAPDSTVSIEHTTLTANEVGVYGGKVDVANDVSFAPLAPGQRDFTVVAGNVDHEKSVYTTTTGNALAFHGKIDGFGTSDTHPIVLLGNTVNVDGANLGSVSPVGSLKIGAVNEVNAKDLATLAATATAANGLSANGLTVKSPATTQFLGGTMTFTNANMDVAGEISVTTGALRELGNEARTITTAPDQKVTFAGTGTIKARAVDVRGGSVAVDSGITFEAKDPTHEKGLDIVAGSESDDGHGAITYTMTRGNDLVFKGKSVNFGATEEEPVALLGATVNLDGAQITGNGYLNAAAANEVAVREGEGVLAKTTDNALTANGLTVAANHDLNFVGGNVTLTDANIAAGYGTVQMTAGSYQEKAGEAERIATTVDQKVTLAGTSNISAQHIATAGGKVSVGDGVTFASANPGGGAFEITAGNQTFGETGTVSTTRGNDVEFHGKIQGMTSANHTVDITGATVNLNSAQIGSAGDNGIVNVMAARTTRIKDADHVDIAASAGNAVSAEGLTVNSGKTNVAGGNVALKDSTVQSSSPALIAAVNRLKFDGAEKTATAAKNNVVYMDGAKVKGSDVTTVSGKVQMVDNAEVEGTGNVYLYIGNSIATNAEGKTVTSVTKDNTLDMRGSKLKGNVVDFPSGGAGIYEGSTVTAATKLDNSEVRRTDGSTGVYQRDNTSAVTENGVTENYDVTTEVPPRPAKPVPPPVPESMDAELSAQDEENIVTGRLAAQDALAATSKEEAVASLVKKIAKLNEKVAESPRQTAGIVVGMVKEIAETSTLDAAAKLDLQRAVLDAYAPVQELKDEQDHHTVRTLADAVRAAENTLVTATTHEHDFSNVQPVTFTD